MKTWRNDMLFVLTMVLVLALASACGKKKSSTSVATTTPPTTTFNPAPTNTDIPNSDIRICSLDITNLSINALAAYMFTGTVENMDGPASACLKLYGTSKYFDAAIRIEYEDDFGIHSYNMVKDYTIFSEIKNNALRVIWLDNSGFVELKGSKQSNGKYLTTIKFSNLATTDVAHTYNSTFSSVYDNCKNGYYTVAQCANWTQPIYTSSWGLNGGYYSESQMLTLVDQYLAGQYGSSAYTLGKIQFYLSDVVVQ